MMNMNISTYTLTEFFEKKTKSFISEPPDIFRN